MAYGTNITNFTNFTNITLVAAVAYGTNITNFTNFTNITLVAAVAYGINYTNIILVIAVAVTYCFKPAQLHVKVPLTFLIVRLQLVTVGYGRFQ